MPSQSLLAKGDDSDYLEGGARAVCVCERERNNNANVYNDAHAYDGANVYTDYYSYAIYAIDNYSFYVLDFFKNIL